MVNLSVKQRRIAQLKSKGMKNKDIAKIEYPEAKEHSGEVLVSRQLKKPYVAQFVEQGREIALRKYSINWDILIAKLTVMLNAEKTDFHSGEILPDNTTQLAAIKELAKMLTDLEKSNNQQNTPLNNTELIKALNSNVDEVELMRLVLNQKEQ